MGFNRVGVFSFENNVDANGDAVSGDAGNGDGVNDNGDDDGNLDTNGDGVNDKGNANGDGNRDTNGDGLNNEVNVNGDWCDLHYPFPSSLTKLQNPKELSTLFCSCCDSLSL